MPLSTRDIADASLKKALTGALTDDKRLSHDEVVDLIRSTLDFGAITKQEQDDLRTILTKSVTMQPRSRQLLHNLLTEIAGAIGSGPPRFLLSEKAGNLVCDFLKRTGTGRFPHLDRDNIGLGLLMRLNRPGMIDQGASSLCGPSSLLFNLATDKPEEYAKFGIDLFEKGEGKIGSLRIKPGSDCRNYNPTSKGIHPVDWMMAASIRDSENWFFDYQSVGDEFAGITMPGALEDWFEDAGYKDVRNETNVYFTKSSSTITDANNLFNKGYRVCLFIGANMLYPSKNTKGTTTPDHWVVMRSLINRTSTGIQAEVFTWGEGNYRIPKSGTLSESDFLKNFYGYVAAKP